MNKEHKRQQINYSKRETIFAHLKTAMCCSSYCTQVLMLMFRKESLKGSQMTPCAPTWSPRRLENPGEFLLTGHHLKQQIMETHQ